VVVVTNIAHVCVGELVVVKAEGGDGEVRRIADSFAQRQGGIWGRLADGVMVEYQSFDLAVDILGHSRYHRFQTRSCYLILCPLALAS